MSHVFQNSRAAWLLLGLIGGTVLGGYWPRTPLHAVATDRYDTFAMATGLLDEEVEAVYFLDFLTGDLRATVLGKLGGFNSFFEYNVLQDLGVDPSKNPKFLMVTGYADMQRGGARLQPSQSVVYVAEITTGKVAAYSIPWNSAIRNSNVSIRQPLILLGMTRFRAAAAQSGGMPR